MIQRQIFSVHEKYGETIDLFLLAILDIMSNVEERLISTRIFDIPITGLLSSVDTLMVKLSNEVHRIEQKLRQPIDILPHLRYLKLLTQ